MLLQADSRLYDAGLLRLRTQFKHSFYDLDLAAKLEDIRLRRTGLLEDPSHHRSTAREYAAVFQEARSKVSDDRAAAALMRKSPIRETLLAGLDDWALVEEDAVMRSRLLQVARWADPDPSWRDRVRDPAVRHDRKVLERLAAEAPAADAPPQLLTTLGVLLKQAGGDAEPLLRAAQRHRPTDFWLNYELGRMLTEVKPWDAIGFYRAALALRPEIGSIYYNLGLAMVSARGRHEAMESYQQAITIDPALSAAPTRLGDLLAEHAGQTSISGPLAARPIAHREREAPEGRGRTPVDCRAAHRGTQGTTPPGGPISRQGAVTGGPPGRRPSGADGGVRPGVSPSPPVFLRIPGQVFAPARVTCYPRSSCVYDGSDRRGSWPAPLRPDPSGSSIHALDAK